MNKNTPQIRFRGFEEEWEEKTLSNIAQVERGERVTKKELDKSNSVYPVISGGIEQLGMLDKYNREANTITIAQYGTAGYVAMRRQKFWANDVCYSVFPNYTDNEFLFNELLNQQDYIYSQRLNAIPAHLPADKLLKVPCFIPSLPEQQKIGEFFKTLDELIAAKQDELTKLQQLKAALLEQMFPCEEGSKTTDGGGTSQVIDTLNLLHALNPTASNPTTPSLTAQSLTISHTPNTPRIRFKGFTDEWEKKTIDELFILRNGYTPSKANPEYWTNGTIPWFRMDDIREQGHILKDASQHITPQAVKGSGLFPAGCIIMSTTATIGEHALLIADSLANQRFTVFQTVNRWKTIDMMFFYHYCFILGEWCRRNVNVGGLNAVNISDLRQHKIPFPSMAEQKLIAGVMTAQEEKIKAAKQQIQKLQTIKQAMLQKMFVA